MVGWASASVAERGPITWGAADPDVVVAARGGCQESFVELYDVMAERVRRAAERILRDRHAAEDAVQDTFLAVLEGLGELSDPGAFEGWVMRIARFKAISAARRRDRCAPSLRVHFDDDERSRDFGLVVHRSGAAEPRPVTVVMIRSAYEEMSSCVRETLRLKYREGLSCEAIAREQGVSIGCVKTRLHRGRRELYDAIGRRAR